jgi:hypothetical protein
MKTNQSPRLVNTADPKTGIVTPINYARTSDGKIDLDAYKGKYGQVVENNLTIDVKIVDARRRYGHLDLKVTPLSGSGQVWVERKNIEIHDDPATTNKKSSLSTKKNMKVEVPGKDKALTIDELQGLISTILSENRVKFTS